MNVEDDNAEGLEDSGNGSNEVVSERRDIDLERGFQVVNPSSPGDVRRDS